MNETSSPLKALFRQYMKQRNLDRKQLGHRLAGKGNTGKAFRRLDELLQEQRFLPETIARVAQVLEIPPAQLEVAWEAQCAQIENAERLQRQRDWESMMKRRGPHLWARLPKDWYPSLITVVGPEFFLMTPIPAALRAITCEYEHLRAVGEFVENHHRQKAGQKFAAYEYRRSVEEIHLFSTDGQWLEQISAPPGESRVRQDLGGQGAPRGLRSLLGIEG